MPGRYQREYFEQTLGHDPVIDGPADKIIDTMVERGAWCVGTPDDLVAAIKRLDEASGGYGGLLIQTTEWSTREQMLHSYELVARYVMPQFQGSLANLQQSQALSARTRTTLKDVRSGALARAHQDYLDQRERP